MCDSAPSPSCYLILDTDDLCEEAEMEENVLWASLMMSTKWEVREEHTLRTNPLNTWPAGKFFGECEPSASSTVLPQILGLISTIKIA